MNVPSAVIRDEVVERLKQVEQRWVFSAARLGTDFEVSPDDSGLLYEALTPEGAVYLEELREAGFFDSEIVAAK